MNAANLASLIESLDDNIDDLEETLTPFIKPGNATNLPLLDKARSYVLVTYAIESLLFSYLRLNGINAKEHPIFRELTRVKQYFEKIKNLDLGGDKRAPIGLDKEAAGRFIKHALAGNEKFDFNRAKQADKSKLKAPAEHGASFTKRSADRPSDKSPSTMKISFSQGSQLQPYTSCDEPVQHLDLKAAPTIKFEPEYPMISGSKNDHYMRRGHTADGEKARNHGRRQKKPRISSDV